MDTKVLNYRVVIEPDERTGTGKACYSALCPTLGVASDGDTIDETLVNIKEAISVYIDSLLSDGEEIPMEKSKAVITSVDVRIKNANNTGFYNFA